MSQPVNTRSRPRTRREPSPLRTHSAPARESDASVASGASGTDREAASEQVAASAQPATQDPPTRQSSRPSRDALREFVKQLRSFLESGAIRRPRAVEHPTIVDLSQPREVVFATLRSLFPAPIVTDCNLEGAIMHWVNEIHAEAPAPAAAPAASARRRTEPSVPVQRTTRVRHQRHRERSRRQSTRRRHVSSSESASETSSSGSDGDFDGRSGWTDASSRGKSSATSSSDADTHMARKRKKNGALKLASKRELLTASRQATWVTFHRNLCRWTPKKIQKRLFEQILAALQTRRASPTDVHNLVLCDWDCVPASVFLTRACAETLRADSAPYEVSDFLEGISGFLAAFAPRLRKTWRLTAVQLKMVADGFPRTVSTPREVAEFIWAALSEVLQVAAPGVSMDDLREQIRGIPLRLRSSSIPFRSSLAPAAEGRKRPTGFTTASRPPRQRRTLIKDVLGERLYGELKSRGFNISSLVHPTPQVIPGLELVSGEAWADPTRPPVSVSQADADTILRARRQFARL